MSTILNILHFNDVYRVTPQRVAGTSSTIDVTQFAALLDSLRDNWPKGRDNGLVLFSGDVFSPSVESSVTRGSHMVPVMNEIMPDIALTGNHDFDFGYPHLSKLLSSSKFPWILSNIVDTDTSHTPKGLERFKVFADRSGLTVGIIGLVEPEWIATVGSWPPNFEYQPMNDVGIELSKLLRDPAGEHKCDLVLALTHSRIPNDITLAKQLCARPDSKSASQHGVDVIFGGHDHMYYIGRGIKEWEGYDFDKQQLGAEEDDGLLIVKSGTDFRDLSAMEVEVVDAPEGSIRRKVVKSIKGKHHSITPDLPSSEPMKKLLSTLLKDVSSTLQKPVCRTLTEFDCRSSTVRTEESASGNWFADVGRHAYDDSLCMKGVVGADGVLICGGTIRGDTVYGPGLVTLGDILEILPFDDPMVVIEMDGSTLWAALESSLGTWPSQEGRFPILSGFRAEWDSRKPPGQRVLGVWEEVVRDNLHDDNHDHEFDINLPESRASSPVRHHSKEHGDPVSREPGGKKYVVVTREYMARGHDGYEALKDCKYVGGIDDENGMLFSSIVRKYLLGSDYLIRMKRLATPITLRSRLHSQTTPKVTTSALSPRTSARARARWLDVGRKVIAQASRQHNKQAIHDALKAAKTEHMTDVDVYDGERARTGKSVEEVLKEQREEEEDAELDLVEVAPVVDGRLRNVGKQ